MPSSVNNGGPYEVHGSAVIAKALRELQEQAKRDGRGQAVLKAIRQIYRKLRHDPKDFGEPLYRLPVLGMQVRSGLVRPLVVHFAVCEDRPLVFIKGVVLLSDNP